MVTLVAEQTLCVEGKLALALLRVLLESLAHTQPGPPEVQNSNIVYDIAIACVNPVQHCGNLPILSEHIAQAQASTDQRALFGTIHEEITHPLVQILIEIAF